MKVNQQKFLVTWIESSGFIRGQATGKLEEAERMYDTIITAENLPQYAEIRRIGAIVRHFNGPKPTGVN